VSGVARTVASVLLLWALSHLLGPAAPALLSAA
jgi:hypothetical protein